MSAPRRFARSLFVLTAVLLTADVALLALQGGLDGLVLFGFGLSVHLALSAGWRLRMHGRLRSSGRRMIWPAAAALYGAAALASVLFGGGGALLAVVLNVIALILAVSGGLAEHRRTGERIHFVMQPAQPV